MTSFGVGVKSKASFADEATSIKETGVAAEGASLALQGICEIRWRTVVQDAAVSHQVA